MFLKCAKLDKIDEVSCDVAYPIDERNSFASVWAESVRIGTKTRKTNRNFTRIPSGVYDLKPRVRSLHFYDIDFRSIEVGDVQHLESLRITLSMIGELENNIFIESTELRDLVFFESKIKNIQTDAFKGLRNLKRLSLQRSFIEHISEEIFENVPSLERLTLHDNAIKIIPSDTFRPLKALVLLDLSSNLLESFDSSLLKVSPSVKDLYLHVNEIQSIELTNLHNLTTLIMNENDMETLNKKMFRNNDEKKFWSFRENKLESIDPEILRMNSNLLLDVQDNPCSITDAGSNKSRVESVKMCFKNFREEKFGLNIF